MKNNSHIRELDINEILLVSGSGDSCVDANGNTYADGYKQRVPLDYGPPGSYMTQTCWNGKWTDFFYYF